MIKEKILKLIDVLKGKRCLIKGSIPYLEFNVVDHCNLNCAGCDHFCPLIKEPVFADLDIFAKDIRELSKKLNIRIIRIMGGEPLLNPQINDFIRITREAFPYSDIRVATNGLLLPTMKEDFWNVMRNYKIKIDLSKYPVVGDKFSQYLDLCDDNGIDIGAIHLAKKFNYFFNEKGDSDYIETWKHCSARNCANLWNSKLYQCCRCFIEISNKEFNMNIPGPKAMDIYKMSGKQIEKICMNPTTACAYCNTINPPVTEWKQSKKDKKEWFLE